MLGNRFYNQSFRKLIVAFGQVFNNIVIQRENATGGVTSRIKVPLAYAPKEKFLVRLDQQKYSKVKTGEDGKKTNYNYTPVPYNISLQLYIFTATAEDGLQIIEQILPYFQPDYTVTVNMVPKLDIKRDIPIVLGNINYEDSYDGDFTSRRAVIYTINFTAKTYLFGPMNNQGVIKSSQADLGTDTDNPLSREERVVVIPNPTTADADDDFGFTTTISFFNDGKRYNPSTDKDE